MAKTTLQQDCSSKNTRCFNRRKTCCEKGLGACLRYHLKLCSHGIVPGGKTWIKGNDEYTKNWNVLICSIKSNALASGVTKIWVRQPKCPNFRKKLQPPKKNASMYFHVAQKKMLGQPGSAGWAVELRIVQGPFAVLRFSTAHGTINRGGKASGPPTPHHRRERDHIPYISFLLITCIYTI